MKKDGIYTQEGVKYILLSWMKRLSEDENFVRMMNSKNVSFLLETVNEEAKKLYEQRESYFKEIDHIRNLAEIDYDEE